MKVLMVMDVFAGAVTSRWGRSVDWPDGLPFPSGSDDMIVFSNGELEQSVAVRWIEYHPGKHDPKAVFHCISIAAENLHSWMAEHYPGWERR